MLIRRPLVSPQPDGELVTVFNLDKFMKTGQPESALPSFCGRNSAGTDLPVDPTDNKSQWVRQASEKSVISLVKWARQRDINLMMICIF